MSLVSGGLRMKVDGGLGMKVGGGLGTSQGGGLEPRLSHALNFIATGMTILFSNYDTII